MIVKPNQTILRGMVQDLRPEPDGWGAEVDLHVEQNESTTPQTDFIRPEAGSVLKAFTPEPEKFRVGQRVRVEATLHAGPTGQRVVLQSVEPADQ